MFTTTAQRLLAFSAAILLALACLVAALSGTALAEGDGPDTTPSEPSELQQRVEESAVAYNAASAHVEELQQRIDENSAHIAEVEAALPAQQEKADTAVVSIYKLSENSSGLTGALMSVQGINEFFSVYEYLTSITSSNFGEIQKLQDMERELNNAQSQLLAEKAEADEAKAQAESALAEAKAAREEAQAAAAAAISAQEIEAAKAQAVEAAVEVAVEQGASEEEVQETRAAAEEAVKTMDVTGESVDWSADKDAFVDEWSARIDAYLEGSPMEGQGSTFASAAWDYGVDPRWSPAIANTESTKGEYTFADHNAWGWGSSSWDNWEEAINDHVKGLADGYGSTITEEGAAKYCPPNADHWYSSTLDQMNKI